MMSEKVINWVVGLAFFSLFLFAMMATEEKQSEFKAKCDAIGGIVVTGHHVERYCNTQGTRFEE